MPLLYSQNFDALAVGATLPELVGSSAALWAVSTTGAVSSPNSYRNGHAADSDFLILNGPGAPAAVADIDLLFSTFAEAGASYAMSGPILRANGSGASWTSGYVIVPSGNTGGTLSLQLFRKTSAGFTGVSTLSTGQSFAANTPLRIRSRAIGGTVYAKAWAAGSAEPANWQCSWNESAFQASNPAYAAAGYAGVYQATNSTARSTGLDDLSLSSVATLTIAPTKTNMRVAALCVVASGVIASVASGRALDVYVRGSETAVLAFDTANAPVCDVQYRCGNGPIQRASISSSNGTVSIALPYSGGKYHTTRLRVWLNVYEASTGLWSNGTGGWRLTGITLDDTGSLVRPPDLRTIEFRGDSITASVRRLYTGSETTALQQVSVMSAADHWPELVADDLGMMPVTAGFGGVGLAAGGNGGVPKAIDNLPYVFGTTAYAPDRQPDVVVVHLGTNGTPTQAEYQAYIAALRSARPGARILLLAPPGKGVYATIQAAIAASGVSVCTVLDIGASLSALGGEDFTDTIGHVSSGGAQLMAQLIVSYLQPLLEADRTPAVSDVKSGVKWNYGQSTGTLATGGGGYPLLNPNFVLEGVDLGDGTTKGKYRPPDSQWYLTTGPGFGINTNLTYGSAVLPPAIAILAGWISRKGGVDIPGRYVPPAQAYYLTTGPGYGVDGAETGTAIPGSGPSISTGTPRIGIGF